MKIIFCLNSIQHLGGIAKVTIIKANALINRGQEVYVIVTDHDKKIPTDLDRKVNLINLNINYYKDDWKSKFYVLKGFFIKRRQHKKKLKKFLYQINPNIIVSVGQSEKFFLPEIKGPWKTIREFHYDKLYRIRSSNNFFQKIIARLINFYDFNFIIKKYNKIVVLTNEDKIKNWKDPDIVVIPNPITISVIKQTNNNNKNIIAVGRLETQKNFQSLIRAFKFVIANHQDWKLEIWGEGSQKENLNNLIKTLHLEKNIMLKGPTENMSEVYSGADILVMSSSYEGWGLVLTEAMAHSVPVISYDCPCGPKDIIQNGYNGILVTIDNEVNLAQSINYLIENKEMREEMGKNALESSKKYSIDKIINQILIVYEDILQQ